MQITYTNRTFQRLHEEEGYMENGAGLTKGQKETYRRDTHAVSIVVTQHVKPEYIHFILLITLQ
jgi:hypothetical protein